MKIYWLRHGQAENNATEIFSFDSILGSPLTELGKQEIEVAAEILLGCGITRIISSDFLRTKQSTEIVNKKLNLGKERIFYDARLHEISVGDLRGTLQKNKPADFRENRRKYNAETYEDVYERARAVIDEILAFKHEGNVLISGSGLTNAMLMYCACEGTREPFDQRKLMKHKPLVNAAIRMVDMSLPQNQRRVEFVHGGERPGRYGTEQVCKHQ